MSTRIAVVGDVHLQLDGRDVEILDGAGYDLVLFVGDLAGYTHQGGVEVARTIATLRTPTLVMPGNHDGVHVGQLLAEMFERPRLRRTLGRRMLRRCDELAEALRPHRLVGYSLHPLDAHGLTVIAARPHAMGGSRLTFPRYLEQRFGVRSLGDSKRRMRQLVDESPHDRVLFLGHNGPTGLGSRREDIWGCDFREEAGDFGDDDLAHAIEHAHTHGRTVLAVVAGHMHHALRGGGDRDWRVRDEGVLHVNAARVPRMFRRDGAIVRHHVELTIDGDRVKARELLLS